MRANAKRSDDELLFPRRNLELLGEHGFLALTVPEEYGGLGENHVGLRDDLRPIARYGCASTAMCYVMHMGAVNTIMFRPTPELIDSCIHHSAPARWERSRTRIPRPARTSGIRSPPGRERSNGGYKVRRRRRRGRLLPASPTSTSSRRRARTSPATTTSRCSSSTARTQSRSHRSGTRSACAATSPGRSKYRTSRFRRSSSSAPRETARRRTTSQSTRGS